MSEPLISHVCRDAGHKHAIQWGGSQQAAEHLKWMKQFFPGPFYYTNETAKEKKKNLVIM